MKQTIIWAVVGLLGIPLVICAVPAVAWALGIQEVIGLPSGNKSLVLAMVASVRTLWAVFWFGIPAVIVSVAALGPPPSGRTSPLHAGLAAVLVSGTSGAAYALRPGWFYDGHLVGCGLVLLGLVVSSLVTRPRRMGSGTAAA